MNKRKDTIKEALQWVIFCILATEPNSENG